MSIENWKPIRGCEGHYMASNAGRVLSCKPGMSERIMKQNIGTTGYWQVRLTMDGNGKGYKVHRLIAAAFIPNPENKPCINHIDGNRLNNALANLEWCTHKENQQHASKMGRCIFTEKHRVAIKKSNGKVILNQATGIFYDTLREAADAIGMNWTTFHAHLKGYTPNKTQCIYT